MRLWYPQLDVYDAVRRLTLLLFAFHKPLSKERMFILDFYFANSPLLHKLRMNEETRKAFDELKIKKSEKGFLSFPASPVLFTKMEPVQKEAERTLLGKGMLNIEEMELGNVSLSDAGRKVASEQFLPMSSDEEQTLLEFLISLNNMNANDIEGLRRQTGLRRMA